VRDPYKPGVNDHEALPGDLRVPWVILTHTGVPEVLGEPGCDPLVELHLAVKAARALGIHTVGAALRRKDVEGVVPDVAFPHQITTIASHTSPTLHPREAARYSME
jgi:hypothetical protein